MKITSILMIALGIVFTMSVEAQSLKTPVASPQQYIKQDFALSSIEITYSRPAMRGRKIFGDLVPYGKLWRTGANAATKLKFNEDVSIDGKMVQAGEYALYSIPGEKSWEIILNKGVNNWGIGGYIEEDDVLRFKANTAQLPFQIENFTIITDQVSGGNCTISIIWEKTIVSFTAVSEIDSKIMDQIEEVMMADKRPYFQAANYYYESDKDMNQALVWINKAIEQNPKAFWVVYLKAKIQQKMGDKKGAKATAEESIKLAKEAGNNDYVALNLKLIDSL